MVFNSIPFVVFFLIFFILYWFVLNKDLKLQNLLLLAGSYVFMGWFDLRFLLYLVISCIVNFALGIYIAKFRENEKRQSILLTLGVIYGIGTLFFFKYYNFFLTSAVDFLNLFHLNTHAHTLKLILPLGISFYTFKAVSYLIDVKNERIEPTKDWVTFFAYLSFFPSLLSGPIDKARDFVPQLEKPREFNYSQAVDGLRQILWGLFKKIVIADYCAGIIDPIFSQYQDFPSSTLVMVAFLYSIQLYADFSGYTDMAIGIGRLLGFNVMKNFNYPFFAQNISEFWQKWHISLTAWLTEYVFTPLAFIFRDYGKAGTILAIIINFILIGLWHGANWTFVVYGFLHGCYFIPLILKGSLNKNRVIASGRLFPSLKEIRNVIGTFVLVTATLVIFRLNSLSEAVHYYQNIFTRSIFSMPHIASPKINLEFLLFYITLFFTIEWIGRDKDHALAGFGLKWKRPLRWSFYAITIIVTFYFLGKGQKFIYFQF